MGTTRLARGRVARWRRETVAQPEAGGRIARTPVGPVEYGSIGEGEPGVALHGAPGGYD